MLGRWIFWHPSLSRTDSKAHLWHFAFWRSPSCFFIVKASEAKATQCDLMRPQSHSIPETMQGPGRGHIGSTFQKQRLTARVTWSKRKSKKAQYSTSYQKEENVSESFLRKEERQMFHGLRGISVLLTLIHWQISASWHKHTDLKTRRNSLSCWFKALWSVQWVRSSNSQCSL